MAQLVNGKVRLYMRNNEDALEVFSLQNLADLQDPKFNDLPQEERLEAHNLLGQLEASPAYAADLASAGEELLKQQAERRARKKSLVVEVVPQRKAE